MNLVLQNIRLSKEKKDWIVNVRMTQMNCKSLSEYIRKLVDYDYDDFGPVFVQHDHTYQFTVTKAKVEE